MTDTPAFIVAACALLASVASIASVSRRFGSAEAQLKQCVDQLKELSTYCRDLSHDIVTPTLQEHEMRIDRLEQWRKNSER